VTTTAKGRAGEDRAVLHLEREGYVIVGRNVRAGHDEIDVVAKDGETLCFIEVRRRARTVDAMVSITAQKRSRIVRCASAYIAKMQPAPTCRFDVVLVQAEGCTVVKGAFEATERDLGFT
jgi:putative endonuclease